MGAVAALTFIMALGAPSPSAVTAEGSGTPLAARSGACRPLDLHEIIRARGTRAMRDRLRRELHDVLDAKLPCDSPAPVVHTALPTGGDEAPSFAHDSQLIWAAILGVAESSLAPHHALRVRHAAHVDALGRKPGGLLLHGTCIDDGVSPRDIIAGAGVRHTTLSPATKHTLRDGNVTIAAVRGHYTLAAVREAVPAATPALGDPLLFAPWLLPSLRGMRVRGGGGVCALAHWHEAALEPAAHALNLTVISAAQPLTAILRSIAWCDVVVTSSVRGLALADALGVPSVLFSPPDHPTDELEYWDYASALVPPGRAATSGQIPPDALFRRIQKLVGTALGAWQQADLRAVVRGCTDGTFRARASFKQRAKMALRFVKALPMDERLCAYEPATLEQKRTWWEQGLLGAHGGQFGPAELSSAVAIARVGRDGDDDCPAGRDSMRAYARTHKYGLIEGHGWRYDWDSDPEGLCSKMGLRRSCSPVSDLVYWAKFATFARHLDKFEWMCYLDADMIITNQSIGLDVWTHLGTLHGVDVIATDMGPRVNAGAMCFRNTHGAWRFLREWITAPKGFAQDNGPFISALLSTAYPEESRHCARLGSEWFHRQNIDRCRNSTLLRARAGRCGIEEVRNGVWTLCIRGDAAPPLQTEEERLRMDRGHPPGASWRPGDFAVHTKEQAACQSHSSSA